MKGILSAGAKLFYLPTVTGMADLDQEQHTANQAHNRIFRDWGQYPHPKVCITATEINEAMYLCPTVHHVKAQPQL